MKKVFVRFAALFLAAAICVCGTWTVSAASSNRMVRVGLAYGSGALVEDSQFKNNIKGATAAGIKVGLYFYSQAINEQVKATKDFQGANGTINFAANGDMVASQGVYDVEGTTPVYVGSFQIVDGSIVQVD